MTTSLAPTDAIDLLSAAYVGPVALPPLKVRKTPRFAQSYLLKSGVLVIPGMNERTDRQAATNQWHRYGKIHGWSTYNQTIAGTIWLSLFAQYAFEIARVFWPHVPKLIIGHSLGAGCAQILAHHFQCPAMCFAVPAVASRRGPQLGDRPDILNVVTRGDWLPALLPNGPVVRRFGQTLTLPVPRSAGSPHKISTYRAAVHAGSARLPKRWPG